MPRTSPLLRALDFLLELGWLFIIIAVPVFFNARDQQVFEQDKVVLVRNTVLAMVVVYLIKAFYLAPYYLNRWLGARDTAASASILGGLRLELRKRPVLIAALVFALIYVLATLTSILPSISFWGSYDRREGTYTYLTYITLFLILATHLRSRNQVERIVTAIILGSVPAAAYSWLQHFKDDPLLWADPVQAALRTTSTMGNAIFLGAALVMPIPFTIYRLVLRVRAILHAEPNGAPSSVTLWTALGAAGYGAALGLQLAAMGFSGSRGPALGLLAALLVFGFCVALRVRIAWLIRVVVACAVVLLIVFAAANTAFRNSGTTAGGAGLSRLVHLLPSESGTAEVRQLLWQSAPGLWEQHPLLGCGPEVLLFCWYPHYPAALRNVELANAAPDRSHDEEIDILLTTGLLGILAYLALLVAIGLVFWRLVRTARDVPAIMLAAALLAAFLGHIVEGATGIAFSVTLVYLWTIAAVGTALLAGEPAGLAAPFSAVAGDAPLPAVPPAREAPVPSQPRARDRQTQRGKGGARGDRGTRRNARPAQAPAGRYAPTRGPRYLFGASFTQMRGGGLALLGLGTVFAMAVVVACVALFVANIQLVLADVQFRTGQNFEQAAGNLLQAAQAAHQSGNTQTEQTDFQTALSGYQEAITAYQNALNAEPGIDIYSLNLGKTYIEYGGALLNSTTANKSDVIAQLQAAYQVFTQAAKLNPLDPDHPRNIAKLYEFWGLYVTSTPDIGKLTLADHYYGIAHGLAPHNADILDEWGNLDVQIGGYDQAHSHRWLAQALDHLTLAQSLFPQDGGVYRDLGSVYKQYGDWAQAAKNQAQALGYYRQAEQAWLTALKYAAPQYQQIYPKLAQLYLTNLNRPCDAGTYAALGLQAIKSNAVADPNGAIARFLNQAVENVTVNGARFHCPAGTP